ncbi:ABC transporter ATP-binding protein [Streptomyces sp. CL12]|uniref:ABC transporter ATP-binding protein n=1 Tax=Streptomyces sp. CL12 TaxID=3391744 RepID=UPI003A804D5B
MTRGRHRLRVLLALCGGPVRRQFLTSLAVTVVGALCLSTYPYGLKLIADGLVRHDVRLVEWGTGLVAGLYTLGWAAGVLGANLDFGLMDRASLYAATRIATCVNAVTDLAAVEDSQFVRELDLLRERQPVLAGFPRQILSALQIVVRALCVMVLLGLIFPPLALLPLAGAAPFLGERLAARARGRADRETNGDKRLSDAWFGVGTRPAAAFEVRAFGLASVIVHRHRQARLQVERRAESALRAGALYGALGWLVFTAAFMLGVGLVIRRAIHGESNIGEVLLAMTLLRRIQVQFSQASGLVGKLSTGVRAAGRLAWLEDYAMEHGDSPTRTESLPGTPQLHDGVRLHDVSFAYEGAPPVLDGVNLEIPAGSVVAVVGENGVGKSTLVKLLTGLYQPTRGRVEADGCDLREYASGQWREYVTGAFQDYQHYELMCGQNVGLGDLPRIDDEQGVRRALEYVGAVDLADELPEGLRTPLGRSFGKSVELSGGQWQKIALGRALMPHTPLLVVLDEPTAALDPAAEQELFEQCTAFAREAARISGTVTVLVSHRFSTVRNADLIVVMGKGGILEHGSHQDLMAKDGTYAELFTLQASAYL